MTTNIIETIPTGRIRTMQAEIFRTRNRAYLRSYSTIVASIDRDGNFHRHWSDWSSTTANHVRIFRSYAGLPSVRKAEWLSLPVERCRI